MVWKTAVLKLVLVEQEFSLHKTVAEAQAAAIELEKFMGLAAEPIALRRCPSTGEWLVVVITKEA